MTDLKTYAAALQDAVKDQGAAWRELAALAGTLAEKPELKRGLIDAAARPGPVRRKQIAKLLSPVSAPVARLVGMLLEERALDQLPELADTYSRALSDSGYVRVHLETPNALRPTEELNILKALSIKPGQVLLTTAVAGSLLGGVRATVDDRVYDATIGGRLNRVEEAVISNG